MRRRLAIFLSFSLVFVVIVFYSQIRLGILTGLFLWDLLDEKISSILSGEPLPG